MNEYFASRTVVDENGCWEWSRSRNRSGYGFLKMAARSPRPIMAHRLSYEMHVAPIPAGMTVDHLCFNPPCVNPEHLRLLTLSENSSHQLDSYKTHCKRGHEFTPENTRIKEYGNGRRECKTCHRERERARWRAARPQETEPAAAPRRLPEHLRTDDINDYLRQKGELQ